MSRVVFMLEEYSMKVLLEGLLPRFFPHLSFLCVSHEGKQDLEKSIPRKLRAWNEPGVRFIIVRDKDSADCQTLKARLVKLCREGRRPEAVVRIACEELEAWYLGDGDALSEAFADDRLRELSAKERFRDPDAVVHPSRAVEELIPEFQKVAGARLMAPKLRRDSNRSRSFNMFIESVARAAAVPGPMTLNQEDN